MQKHKVNLGTARLFIIMGKPRLGVLAGSYSNVQNVVTLRGEHFRLVGSNSADINQPNYIEERIVRKDGSTKVIQKFEDGTTQYRIIMNPYHV